MKINALTKLFLITTMFLASHPAVATISFIYQNVPSTILHANDTFSVTVALQNDGSQIRAANLKVEMEPVQLAFVTGITILPGTTASFTDSTTSRLFVDYGAGNSSGTIQLAQIDMRVGQCIDATSGILKVNPLSVAINTPVKEAQSVVDQRYTLNFELKDCAPPAPPGGSENNGVGDGSYETTDFQENPLSSTAVAGCAVGSSRQGGFAIFLVFVGLLGGLVMLRKLQSPNEGRVWIHRVIMLVTISFILFSATSEARIYHVDNSNGSACNGSTCTGDQNTPFDSIGAAFAAHLFEPGDEIFIHQGTYNESTEVTVNVNGNGRLGLPIRIRGETDLSGNNLVTINGGTAPGLILKFLISYWSIENINFQNGGAVTVNTGVTAPPTSLLLYLVGPQINVVKNNFSGTVSGGTLKSAMHLSTATSYQPLDIFNGHLIKGNSIINMGLGGTGSAGFDLSNFDYSFLQNNTIIHSNPASAPEAAVKVIGGFHSVIERNALLNSVNPSSAGVGALILSSPRRMAIRNNIIFSRSFTGAGSGGLDDFMGPMIMVGSGSSAEVNRVHHNSIVNATLSPGNADIRRSSLMVLDYGNGGNYSDWVNNVLGTLSPSEQAHFLWTGAYTTNAAADSTKRVFIDYNSISSRFYSSAPNIPGAALAAPLYADRLNPNSLHDQTNNAADFGVVCAQIGNTLGLPNCKRRDYVGYAGSSLAATPFYSIDFQFSDGANQTFVDHNNTATATHFAAAALDPFTPANYAPGTFAVGANGQARCSDFIGNTNASCDGSSGHLGGPAQLHYGSTDNVSICSPDPAKQLDVYPTTQEPDRRLTAADYVQLKDNGQPTLATKVGNYLVTLSSGTYLTCP
jgi:hypothetical protein